MTSVRGPPGEVVDLWRELERRYRVEGFSRSAACAKIGELYGVRGTTVYRWIKREELEDACEKASSARFRAFYQSEQADPSWRPPFPLYVLRQQGESATADQ